MKTSRPRVSIGLPVYNGDRFLAEALDSLLRQTYADFDLIISDNASTDSTAAICQSYAERDQRIRYNRQTENLGVARNFNRVFELSTGEYFKWATADDLCMPDYLRRCVDVLDTNPTVVVACGKTIFIDETGGTLEKKDPGWDLRSERAQERMRYVIFSGHWVNCHYGLIRADALWKSRLFPNYPGGDYRLLAELSLLGKFYEIPDYLFLRRVHLGASSKNAANLEWLTAFFQQRRGRVTLAQWNLNFDLLVTLTRSNLCLQQKLSLTTALLHRMYWQSHDLMQELKAGLKQSISRVSREN